MPPADAELSYTVLLEHITEHPFNSYNENDYFTSVAWIDMTDKSAVALAGQKAYGEYYYGYRDGSTTFERQEGEASNQVYF